MTISGSNLFMGAYTERVADRTLSAGSWLPVSEDTQREITNQVAEALKQIKASGKKQDSVSISEEGKAFLCSDAVKDNMRESSALLEKMYTDHAKLQEKLQQTSPDDPFWSNTGNQWLGFSEHLHSNGFYDSMSDEEVIAAETLLDKMTCGMDGMSSSLYHTGLNIYAGNDPDKINATGFDLFNESRDALAMDLESSTAALKYFGETYIADEALRNEFNGLVDKYYSHNAEILQGYQSPAEKMQKAISNIHSGKYPNSAVFNKSSQNAIEQYSERLNADSHLASVSHASEEENQYQKDISILFEQLKQGASGWDDMWKKLENALVDYTSDNSDNESIRQAASEQAGVTLNRMKGYWSLLMNR